MRKRLYICGDSFSSISKKDKFKGTSWSEVLANKLDWELVNLARPGISNGGIRLQIEKAIQERADFVFIVPTFPDRIELPGKIDPPQDILLAIKKKNKKNLIEFSERLPLFLPELDYGYDPTIGLSNIDYSNEGYRLISAPLIHLVEGSYKATADNKGIRFLLKQYITMLYDPLWKKQNDQWIIREAMFNLYDNDIPFSLDPGYLWSDEEFKKFLPNKIDKKYFRINKEETLRDKVEPYAIVLESVDDPGYHSLPENQDKIADAYYFVIKQYWTL